MNLYYITGGGKKKRYYRIKKRKNKSTGKVTGDVSRVTCAEYDDASSNPTLGRIRPNSGDRVTIIVKPYHQYNCVTGTVKDVLTRKELHTRGHKVRLTTGVVGRTLKILS
jgi:uncharacterized repeat protein (TIGR03833 family)